MLRYISTFLIGAVVGAVIVLLIVPQPAEMRARSVPGATSPAPAQEPAARERQVRALGGVEKRLEEAVADEPMGKPLPTLAATPILGSDSLVIPVAGVHRDQLTAQFNDSRGGRVHHAIDIAATRGTPVLAAIDGPVGKLFLSKPGGITIYQFDPAKEWIYYYAHLDGYAPGIVEGKQLTRGEVIGFVGTSGNAPPNAPHLHFAIEKLTTPGKWWQSEPVDPFPLLSARGVTVETKP